MNRALAFLRALSPALLVGAAGCAALSASLKESTATVTSEQVAERNKALDSSISALNACAAKGQPTDAGLVAVSAKADGSVSVDSMQWLGSDAMKECINQETPKVKLPAWSGPTVSVVWAIGTKDRAAPAPRGDLPSSYIERLNTYLAATMDVETGPLIPCVQRNLPEGAYALVKYRLFVFPDGKVKSVTPWSVAGEGRDVGFINCARDLVGSWEFPTFEGPGFYMTEVTIKRGVDSTNK